MATKQRVQSSARSSKAHKKKPAPALTTEGREKGRKGGLVTKKCERTGEEFTLFFGRFTAMSQFHPCTFKVDGVDYNCAEQYMMHKKACLFGDDSMAERILHTSTPKTQKALGRQVKNFDEGVWKENCKRIVKDGNLAKFSQNADLKEQLLSTGSSTLVEASPRDRRWGIGLGSSNPKATDRRLWRGSNWLGEILTEVREELREEDSSPTS